MRLAGKRTEPGASPAARSSRARVVVLVIGAALSAVLVAGLVSYSRTTKSDARPSSRTRQEGATRAGAEPLPYVNYVPVKREHRGKSGTTVHVKEKAERGYNLYVPKPDAAAILVDMQGELVHKWSSDVGQPRAGLAVPASFLGWQTARMTPKGELVAFVGRSMLLKLDWKSKVIWKLPIALHHDVTIADNGDIYALTDGTRVVEMRGKKRLITDHGVVIVSPEGEIKRKVAFYDVFMKNETLKKLVEDLADKRFKRVERDGVAALVAKREEEAVEENPEADPGSARATLGSPESLKKLETLMQTGKLEGDEYGAILMVRAIPGFPGDVFHANTSFPLKAHPAGLWKDGDILLSFRNHDLVCVLDPVEEKIVWMWEPGDTQGQHQPTMLPNGNILIFDNGTSARLPRSERRRHSRIVELDPVAKKIVWEYVADPPRSFFSPGEAGCHLLPKGNIIVAEAATGRAFEITRSKEIVWEYFNPKMDETGQNRSGMYRIERIRPEIVEPLLQQQ
jgi:hypothetical protein